MVETRQTREWFERGGQMILNIVTQAKEVGTDNWVTVEIGEHESKLDKASLITSLRADLTKLQTEITELEGR